MPYGNMSFGGQFPIGNNWQQALVSKLFGGGGTMAQSPGPQADMAMAQLLGLYQPQQRPMAPGGGPVGMGNMPMPPGGGAMNFGFGGGLYGQPLPGGGGGSQFANQVPLQPPPMAAQPMPAPAPAPMPPPMAPKPPMPKPAVGNAAFQGRMGAQAFQQMTEGASPVQANMLRRRYGMVGVA